MSSQVRHMQKNHNRQAPQDTKAIKVDLQKYFVSSYLDMDITA